MNREILIKFRSGPPGVAQQALAALPEARVKATLPHLGWQVLELPPDADIAKAIDDFRGRPDVAYAEPNYPIQLFATPNDPRESSLWGLEKVGARQAWEHTTGGTNIIVAVLDSGLDYSHPDIATNVWRNPGEIPNNFFDDDRNGYIDDVHGINLLNNSGDVRDDDGHGTHVAGIIGAVGDNGVGVVGMNWKVKLLPVKIFSADDSAGTVGATEAYEYLLGLKQRGVNIRVVNNSWGGPVPSRALYEAICAAEAAGILTVCAAGNSNRNNDDRPSYPDGFDCESLLSVAASTRDDEVASFSNFGVTTVHLAAPGESVLSTYRGAGHYMRQSGTSMASPFVAGAAALLLARDNTLTPATLKRLLLGTVDPLPQWLSRVRSGGRLNVNAAMSRLIAGDIPELGSGTRQSLDHPRLTGVSRNPQNRWGNAESTEPVISADGRFVAFLSQATNLAAGVSVTNMLVYLHDRANLPFPSTVLACRGNSGSLPNRDCSQIRISADGRFVVFTSTANNLVAADSDFSKDVFLYDRNTGQLELVSEGGFSSDDSEYPAISGEGRFVVFASESALVSGDNNGFRDIFLRDRQLGTTTRVSVNSSEVAANFMSDLPSISADGRYITFISGANNLVQEPYYAAFQLYLRDRVAGATQRISKNASGQPGNNHSLFSALSANGRYVAFQSMAKNLVPGDNNNVRDIFLWDRVSRALKRISVGNNRAQADEDCWLGGVSGSGRQVLFFSYASTLSSQDDMFAYNIFAYDRLTAKLSRLGYNGAGDPGLAGSVYGSPGEDGRFVAFSSAAWNLMPGDGNGSPDVFLLDRGAAIPDLMIYASGESTRQGMGLHGVNIVQRRELSLTNSVATFYVRLDNDGPSNAVFSVRANTAAPGWNARFMRGTTDVTSDLIHAGWTVSLPPASNVVLRLDVSSVDSAIGESLAEWVITATANQNDGAADAVRAVVARTSSPPALQAVSRAADGRVGNDGATSADLSADGRLVVFTSTASDLVKRDYNLQEDVFLVDRQTRSLECLSRTLGTNGNGRSYSPKISRDGRYSVYQSSATNLVTGDANERDDVFLYDRQTGVNTIVSLGPGGVRSSRESGAPAISGDGRYIAFESLAHNFVNGDREGTWDIFLRDMVSGSVQCLSMAGFQTGNDESRDPVISSDGSLVAFNSLASDLANIDTNETVDVFLWERGVTGVKLLSRTLSGPAGSDISSRPSISDDNRYVLFTSLATNLAVPAYSTNSTIFLHDRQMGQLSQINPPRISGRQRGGFFGARLAPDGRFITLMAEMSDVPGGSNYVNEVFLYDRVLGTLAELTRKRDGTPASHHSSGARVSADGRYIALSSRAANLIGEQTYAVDQVLLYDRANFQPDESVRRGTNAPDRGRLLFGETGQIVEQTLKPGLVSVFFVTIRNQGNFADRFIVKAPSNVSGVRYYIQPAGAEITAAVTNKGWTTDLVPAGGSREIRVRVVGNTASFSRDLLFTSRSLTDATKVDNVRFRLLRDDDNDGLPNAWEQQYFGNATTTLAAADSDGDGVSNLAEFTAGTNPADADSNLGITSILVETVPGLTIKWSSTTNRYYSLERASDGLQSFVPVAALPGAPAETSHRDSIPTNGSALFYRVRAELP